MYWHKCDKTFSVVNEKSVSGVQYWSSQGLQPILTCEGPITNAIAVPTMVLYSTHFLIN